MLFLTEKNGCDVVEEKNKAWCNDKASSFHQIEGNAVLGCLLSNGNVEKNPLHFNNCQRRFLSKNEILKYGRYGSYEQNVAISLSIYDIKCKRPRQNRVASCHIKSDGK